MFFAARCEPRSTGARRISVGKPIAEASKKGICDDLGTWESATGHVRCQKRAFSFASYPNRRESDIHGDIPLGAVALY